MYVRVLKIHPNPINLFASIVIGCFFGMVQPAAALSSDSKQPIEIVADNVEADQNTGIVIYTGEVVLTQGTLRMTGSKMTMYFDKSNELKELISIGTPARFRQLPDGKKDIAINYQTAKSNKMIYQQKKDQMILIGNAEYGQDQNTVSAQRIEYNSKAGTFKAKTRTKTTLDGSGNKPKEKSRVRVRIKAKE